MWTQPLPREWVRRRHSCHSSRLAWLHLQHSCQDDSVFLGMMVCFDISCIGLSCERAKVG